MSPIELSWTAKKDFIALWTSTPRASNNVIKDSSSDSKLTSIAPGQTGTWLHYPFLLFPFYHLLSSPFTIINYLWKFCSLTCENTNYEEIEFCPFHHLERPAAKGERKLRNCKRVAQLQEKDARVAIKLQKSWEGPCFACSASCTALFSRPVPINHPGVYSQDQI